MNTKEQKPDERPAPRAARTGSRIARNADGRRDPDKRRENQAKLGVGPEHKTDAMKKGRRGTFP
jgi:hypothetical protein